LRFGGDAPLHANKSVLFLAHSFSRGLRFSNDFFAFRQKSCFLTGFYLDKITLNVNEVGVKSLPYPITYTQTLFSEILS